MAKESDGSDYEDCEEYLIGRKLEYYISSYQSNIQKYMKQIMENCRKKNDHFHIFNSNILLCEAIKLNKVSFALNLLEQLPKINLGEKDQNLDFPLHLAVMAGNYRITRKLLMKGASIDSTFIYKKQPIHLICDRNYTLNILNGKDVIKLLVKHGADVQAIDEYGNTPLHLALECKATDLVDILVANGGITKHVTHDGQCVLHDAFNCMYLKFSVIKLMVSKGFNLNLEYDWNRSVYKEAVKLYLPIVEKAATHTYEKKKQSEVLEKIELLLQNGASVNAVIDDDLNTLLLANCKVKGELNLEFFYKYGADVNAKNKYGETALHFCAKNHPVQCVESLIKHGANINAITDNRQTAIHFAVENKDRNVLEFLLSSGIDVSIMNCNNKSVLYHAVYNGQLENVILLLNRQLNNMEKNIKKEGLLHVAVKQGHENIVRLLLLCKDDINNVDEDGKTILQVLSDRLQKYDPEYVRQEQHTYNYSDKSDSDDEYQADIFYDNQRKLEKEYDIAQRIRDILLPHVAKLVTMSSYVNVTDIKLLHSMDKDQMYQKCLKELKCMKKVNISKNMTLFDVLISNIHEVSSLIKNKTLKDKFCTAAHPNKFPIYYKMLNHILNSALLRNTLFNEAKICFTRMVKANNIQLTDEILYHLFNFLTTFDLKHLASVYPDTCEVAKKEVGNLELLFI